MTRYLAQPTTRAGYPSVTAASGGSDMAKRRYLFFIETDDKKRRLNLRGWPFVILMGLLLAVLSIIDRGGLDAVPSAVGAAACSFTANADDVNVRNGATASSPSVRKLTRGQSVEGSKTVTNGFRQLADGNWVLDGYLTPVPGNPCR